ncbi:MAG: peptidase domain-containing ABC transporter [Eubacterium sp.]|nr:peptidase domain-containing ABC transporter [Eubacterium sp.]
MTFSSLKRVPYIGQMRQTECGLCCVAMLLQYYNSYEGIHNIRKELDVGRDGIKLSLLSGYLTERGLETKIFKAPTHFLNTFQLPAIIFWDHSHFVILEKISDDNYYVVDPAFGRATLKKETFMAHYSDIILTAKPTENFVPYTERSHLWINSFKNMSISKIQVLNVFVASIITYMLNLVIPIFVEHIIDRSGTATFNSLYNKYFPITLCIGIVYALFSFYRGQNMLSMQLGIDRYLTKGTFRKLLHLPYKFFESRTHGDLLFRLSCLSTIRDLISEHILSGIMELGMVTIIIGYMLYKSVPLTLIALAFLIANILFMFKMQSKLGEANQYAVRANTAAQGVQVEAVYSMYGIKIAGMENQVLEDWDDKYKESMRLHRRKCMLQNINDTITQLLNLAGPMVLLIAGIYFFYSGRISIGEIIALYTLAGTLYGSSSKLLSIWTDFTLATSYLERISDIMNSDEEIEPDNSVSLPISGEIDLEHVSFAYNKHADSILEDICMHINPGEKVAIVGTSGSGKSTLFKLLLGLYELKDGNILYDNVNLLKLNKHDTRKQIGVVPQDTSLFNKTIFENIAVNNPNITIEDVESAAEAAQLSNEIEAMPMKYDTLVSDMGMNLSGGQRQRIALARALVNHPKVLILDEATSSLDNINEQRISTYLKDQNCTRIVIAHRLSTIVDSDKIIVLDKGRIKETGTHDELLARKGLYYNIYRSQTNK